MPKLLVLVFLVVCATAQASALQDGISLFRAEQFDKALVKFQELSKKNPKAQGYLAKMYANGLGVPQDFGAALYWASQAAARNDAIGQNVMGYLYLNGYGGLIKDNVLALSYYRKAVEQDDDTAIEQYTKLVLRGHTKEGLNQIEAALTKDKSAASSLVLMNLYGDGRYKPTNLYKSFLYALQSIRRGLASPAWHIIENSGFMQFSDVLNAAWLKAIYDLKHPDINNYPNYAADLRAAIGSLKPAEAKEVTSLTLQQLISKTEAFVLEHQKKYGPILARDLVNEGWSQFVGERNDVNEPLAQLLLEEGLRKSIAMRQRGIINLARNNLGVLLGAAVNTNVQNKRLAHVHLLDGAESDYGPDNLIWAGYEGGLDLTDDQLRDLLIRYRNLNEEDHIVTTLGPLPADLKRKPLLVIQYLITRFQENPHHQIAEQIADMYEDNHRNLNDLLEAKKWYEIRTTMKEDEKRQRLIRMEKILQGRYVKDMPDLRDAIEVLFDLKRVAVAHLSGRPETTAKTPVLPETQRKLVLHALVIGNSSYRSKSLANAVNDSDAIAKKLSQLGFRVKHLTNLPRKSFFKSILDFSQIAANADLTVFFYAGHGVQMGGINYLLPTDIDLQAPPSFIVSEGININDLLRRYLPGKNRVVFLDACRIGPASSSAKLNRLEGLAPVNAPRSTLISFATRDGSVAYDSFGSKNSPYTAALIDGLGRNEDIAIVLRGVREEVLRVTQGKQEPWEYGSLTGGELIFSKLVRQP